MTGAEVVVAVDGRSFEVSIRIVRMVSLLIVNAALIDACGIGSVELPFTGDTVKIALRASIPTRPLDNVKISR